LKERNGQIKTATLFLKDFHHSAEFRLSGFKTERDLFLAAAEHVLHYIQDHFASEVTNTRDSKIYNTLEGSRLGVAVISGGNSSE